MTRSCDCDDEPEIFYGFGAVHDLSEAQQESARPRLAGLRSVSEAAAWAMHRGPKTREPRRHPMGFRRPR